MIEHFPKGIQNQIVDEIISELPLKERTSLANMNREDVWHSPKCF